MSRGRPKKVRNPEELKLGGHPGILQINPDLVKRVLNSVRMGNYIAIAARQYGMSIRTIQRWLAIGMQEPDSIYGGFCRSLDQALAEAEARDLASLDAHANGRDAKFERYPDGHAKAGELVLIKGKPVKLADEVKSDWRAALAKLERRNKRRWGLNDNAQTLSEQELPIDVTPKDVSPEKKALAIRDAKEVLEAIVELEAEEI